MRNIIFLVCIIVCFHFNGNAAQVTPPSNYLEQARNYEIQGNSLKAITLYEKAREEYASGENQAALVYVLDKLAYLYTVEKYEFETAQKLLDRARASVNGELKSNDSLIAYTYFSQGVLYDYEGYADSAIYFQTNALVIRKNIYPEDHLEIANSYVGLGDVYSYGLSDPYQAEKNYKLSLPILEKYPLMKKKLANVYYSLGVALRKKGDVEKSLYYAKNALGLYLHNQKSNSSSISNTYNLIATIYYQKEEYQQSIDYYNMALAIDAKNGNNENLSTLLSNKAESYYKMQQYDSVITLCNQSLNYDFSKINQARCYQKLGSVYRESGDTEKSFFFLKKSLALFDASNLGTPTDKSLGFNQIGKTFEASHQLDSALHYYKLASALSLITQDVSSGEENLMVQEGDDFYRALISLWDMAKLQKRKGEETGNYSYLKEAMLLFYKIDKTLDMSRRSYDNEQSKLFYSGYFKVLYEQAIETAYTLYQQDQNARHLNDVLHFMEKNKAIILSESIRNTQLLQAIVPDSLFQVGKKLEVQLATLRVELVNAENGSPVAQQLNNQVLDAYQELEAFRKNIERQYPTYHSGVNSDWIVDIDSIRNSLTKNQAVISYFYGKSSIYALLIGNNLLKINKIDHSEIFKNALTEYKNILSENLESGPDFGNFQSFERSSNTLYKLLLEPLVTQEKNELSELTIIADDELASIPFESFTVAPSHFKTVKYSKLPYLLRDYTINYQLSASLAFGNSKPVQEPEETKFKAVAFGIENFGQSKLAALGGAKKEAEFIKNLLPETRLFLDSAATKFNFKNAITNADLIHLALHGQANLENPQLNNFIFYKNGQKENDEILYQYEIFNLPIKAKLLVLSACESGVGKIYPGEGNYSLARSFIYSGCQSILMALWSIDDKTTEQLIESFYTKLENGEKLSQAIRNSKLEYLMNARETNAHPQFWAALVSMGNNGVVIPRSSFTIYWLPGLVATLMLLVSRLYYRRNRRKNLQTYDAV